MYTGSWPDEKVVSLLEELKDKKKLITSLQPEKKRNIKSLARVTFEKRIECLERCIEEPTLMIICDSIVIKYNGPISDAPDWLARALTNSFPFPRKHLSKGELFAWRNRVRDKLDEISDLLFDSPENVKNPWDGLFYEMHEAIGLSLDKVMKDFELSGKTGKNIHSNDTVAPAPQQYESSLAKAAMHDFVLRLVLYSPDRYFERIKNIIDSDNPEKSFYIKGSDTQFSEQQYFIRHLTAQLLKRTGETFPKYVAQLAGALLMKSIDSTSVSRSTKDIRKDIDSYPDTVRRFV